MQTPDLKSIENRSLRSKVERIQPFIGSTPLFPVTGITQNEHVRIFAKLEWQQLSGSVKARAAYRIVRDAVEEGALDGEKHLLDASSGNTGIAYAHIGASLGIPVTLCIPENASEERKQTLKALGAEIRYTSKTGTTDEAQEIARKMAAANPGKYYYADQYNNESNWRAHYDTTAPEILRQTDLEVTHFVSALGTTGTFTGTARRLKEELPEIKTISLQPKRAMHGLEGWKHMETAKVPGIYDSGLADRNIAVQTETAYEFMKEAAEKEGLLLSPSSAANLAGALRLSKQIDKGTIVTIFPDNGSRYGEIISNLFNT